MERKPKSSQLSAQGRAYRLWFEYLWLARQSTDPKVKAALVVSEPFYRPWEMEKGASYNEWWKSHSHLFQEKHNVRRLEIGEAPSDPEALILEIPLTKSPTELSKLVKEFIKVAFEAQHQSGRKGKRKATAYYQLSDGAEPKFDAIREMLSVYRDVYLKNPKARGEDLLKATHKYYTGRKNKQWNKVPVVLQYNSKN